MVNLSFALSVTGTYRLRFLAGKIEGSGAYWLLDAIHQCTRVQMIHQLQLHGQHHVKITIVKTFFSYQKRTETSLHKKISKRNLPV